MKVVLDSLMLRIQCTKRSKILAAQSVNVPKTLNASSLKILSVRRCLKVEWHQVKGRISLYELTKLIYALYEHLRVCIFFFDMYGK